MTALLDIQGLRGGYGAVEVLRGVDLHVDAGEIVALLGSNGAGKSTLNNLLCGIYPAWAGRVLFDGKDLSGAHYRDVVKAGLIQVPEGRKIFPNLSVLENLELGSFTRARERRASNLERVFAIFPRLKERSTQMAGTMSGGEQQMLAIGRGLMAEPRLLILDEPSLGLSPSTAKALRCCWLSRTWASRWKSPSAPMCWRTGPSFFPARARTCSPATHCAWPTSVSEAARP